MNVHRPHPITGPWPYSNRPGSDTGNLIDRQPDADSAVYADPDDALLFDGCARCAQHAVHLLSLDDDSLADLWRHMVDVERNPDSPDSYRTVTEAEACRRLYAIAVLLDRTHPALDVWTWPLALRANGITAALDGTVSITGTARFAPGGTTHA